MYDTIIIGGGPAGSTAAREISKKGYRVLLLEKEEIPGKKACGGAVSPKFVKDKRVIKEYIKRFVFHLPEKDIIIGRENPIAVTVKREEFDKSLIDIAKDDGVEVIFGEKALNIEESSNNVIVQTKDREFDTKFLILADGFPSIGRNLGIGAPISDYWVGFVYYIKNTGNFKDIHFYIIDENPYGYLWIFPAGKELNTGIISLKSRFSSSAEKVLDEFIKRRLEGEIIYKKTGAIPILPAKYLSTERVISIGDAGGFVNPIMGGGLNHAINSGIIGAKICISALKAGDNKLSSIFLRYSPDYLWVNFLSYLMKRVLKRGKYKLLLKSYIGFLKCYTYLTNS